MRVLVPDPLPAGALGALPSEIELVPVGDGSLPAGVADARMAVFGGSMPRRLDEIVDAATRLEVLQTVSAGVDWLVGRVPDGVTVCNASGVHDMPVAEWVVAAILAMTRRFPDFLVLQARGEWDRGINSFADGTVQLAAVADPRPRGRPCAHPRPREHRSRRGGAPGAVRRDRDGRRAPRAARGARPVGGARAGRRGGRRRGAAAAHAGDRRLRRRRLPRRDAPGRAAGQRGQGPARRHRRAHGPAAAGRVRAALDVTEPEPLPDGHPLFACPGVLITPHVAGCTERWLERALQFAGDQIRRFAAGEPLLNVRAEGY